MNTSKINYTALEAYPILEDEVLRLNYVNILETRGLGHKFEEMHLYPWEKAQKVTPYFTLIKLQERLENFTTEKCFDVIYFDAFGARVQPELWTQHNQACYGIGQVFCSEIAGTSR